MNGDDVIDASTRMSDFVASHVRQDPLRQDWDSQSWLLPSLLPASARSHVRLHFGLMEGRSCAIPFSESMDRFAKAMCCERRCHRVKPYCGDRYLTLLYALRLLFRCLREVPGRDPVRLTRVDFDRAAMLAVSENGGSVAAIMLADLRFVARTMAERRLAFADLRDWREPVQPDPTKNARFRPMLSMDEASALAHLSSRSDLSRKDQLMMCAVDLLMCGGFRVGEVCTLPFDAVVREPLFVDGELALGADGEPIFRYGLRYWPEKGGSANTMLKAIPSVMVPVALRAVERARALTAEARAVATFQFSKPGTTTLGEPWDSLPEEAMLTLSDVERATGVSRGADLADKARSSDNDGSAHKRESVVVVRKSDLYGYLSTRSFHGNCRPDLTSQSLSLADLLFVLPCMKGGASGKGLRGTATLMRTQAVGVFLRSRGTAQSVFERLGYDVAGKPIALTTHQPRHFLNTLAMQHGLNPMDLARWMGRSRMPANAAYERRSERERSGQLRDKLEGAGAMIGVELPDPRPLTQADLLDSSGAAHLTQIGACEHDLAESPCASHVAFVRAALAIDAGEADRMAEQTRRFLAAAESASARRAWGAEAWVMAHRSFLETLMAEKVA